MMKLNKRTYDGNVLPETAELIYQLGNIVTEHKSRYLFCKFRGYYYMVEITNDIYLRGLYAGEEIPAIRKDYTTSVSDYVSPNDVLETHIETDVDRDDEIVIGRIFIINGEQFIALPSRKRYFLASMDEIRAGKDLNKLRKQAIKFDDIQQIIDAYNIKKELI